MSVSGVQSNAPYRAPARAVDGQRTTADAGMTSDSSARDAVKSQAREPSSVTIMLNGVPASMDDVLASVMRHQDTGRYAGVDWRRLPPDVITNVSKLPKIVIVEPTAEMKAEVAAIHASAANVQAELEAQRAANPQLYSNSHETNSMNRNNVAMLNREETLREISIVTYLIESGEAEKYSFHGGNGNQPTTSIHQYLFWLQARAKGFEAEDGTYSPSAVGTPV